jgi:hypothetical protein
VDPLGECFGRLVCGAQGRAGVGDGVDPALHDGFEQVRTLRKAAVQRADSHAGQVGDRPAAAWSGFAVAGLPDHVTSA